MVDPAEISDSNYRKSGETTVPPKMRVHGLCASFGNHSVLNDIHFELPANSVTALIGPSGCGKSTFLRCLNRMHELSPGAKVTGDVFLDDLNIYAHEVHPVVLRRRVGMVFQKPNPFPTMSVRDNVLAGLKLSGTLRAVSNPDALVERVLTLAALWKEVKDNLNDPGTSLSGGQQQRLCIARALAVDPEVLLMDEPCSALDPIATAHIEQLINQLSGSYSILIVTHNMQQAARISKHTGFFLAGKMIEFSETAQMFRSPKKQETEDYITGKFG
jgi:phosphate transport system ATP-binding protein